jgi:hypothetical protein
MNTKNISGGGGGGVKASGAKGRSYTNFMCLNRLELSGPVQELLCLYAGDINARIPTACICQNVFCEQFSGSSVTSCCSLSAEQHKVLFPNTVGVLCGLDVYENYNYAFPRRLLEKQVREI